MVRKSDTSENVEFHGTVTLRNTDDPGMGDGDLEIEGSVFTDTILSNTQGESVNIENIEFNSGTFMIPNTDPAPAPDVSKETFYTQNGVLKSINSSGTTVYKPLIEKGDIFTRDEISETRLPIGEISQILVVDPTTDSGLNWITLSDATDRSNKTLLNQYADLYNSSSNVIGDVESVIQTPVTRIKDSIYNDSITFLVEGLYIIILRTGVSITNDNKTTMMTHKLQESISNGSYVDIPGTTSSCIMDNDLSDRSNMMSYVIKQYNVNDKVRGIITKNTSNNSQISNLSGATSITALRIVIDTNDNSKYLDTYNTTSTVIGSNFTPITFNVDRYLSTDTFSRTSGSITIITSGKYLIFGKVTTQKTTGNDASLTESRMTVNDVEIPGTLVYTFASNSSINKSSANIQTARQFSAGDVIKLESRVLQGSNISSVSEGCSVVACRLASVTQSQNNVNFFSGYNSGVTSIGFSYTDLPINVVDLNDNVYLHLNDSPEITVLETGNYIIFIKLSTVDTSSSRSTIQFRLMSNNGNGVFESIPGTQSAGNHSRDLNNPRISCWMCGVIPLNQDSVLKIQGVNTSSQGSVQTIPGGTHIIILRIDPVDVLKSVLSVFGTYFASASNISGSTTTSQTFVRALRLSTPVIPRGKYIVHVTYQFGSPGFSTDNTTEVKITLDSSDVLYTHIQRPTEGTQEHTGSPHFIIDILEDGIHFIDLDFRSVVNGNVGVRNCFISSWKVV